MSSSDIGSTVPRRQLGRYLRQAREEAGVSHRAAAEALTWSTPRLWRLEKGLVPVRPADVRVMCRLYGVPTELTEALAMLAGETRASGWWQAYGDAVPTWFELYVGLEAAAAHLRQYEVELIPGLLQTPEYTAEVIAVNHPDMPADERHHRSQLKRGRQRLLDRQAPPVRFDTVVNEAALRRPPGDRAAMAAQLRHLVAVARQRPNVGVRVLPLAAGLHRAAFTGAFIILDFPRVRDRDPEPTTVYSENLTGSLYLDRPGEVAAYQAVWADLTAASLPQAASLELVTAIAEEYQR